MKDSKFVICIDNSEYPASLEKRKIYEVLPDSDAEKIEHIRVVDESGEDYLYPVAMFEIIPAEEQVNIRIGRSIFEKISKIAKKEQLSVEELASQMLEKQLS